MPKFSIILPVRNGGEYVKKCLQSILSQSLHDFNLAVLDNCSEDDTVQWIEQLQDSRITIIKASQPLSMEANWARIMKVPKNEFMTIIGHDDLLHPDYLATMDALIKKHPKASLYQAHFKFIDAKGNDIRPCLPMAEVQRADEFLACEMTRTMDSMGTGYMMRSADYAAAGGIGVHYPNLIFADYELWVKLTIINYKATAQDECFSYRLHNNISKLTNGEQYQQAFGEYMLFLAGLKAVHPQIAKAIEKDGKTMLLYFCESLSHRLLKTDRKLRKTSVAVFIDKCRHYAALLIPGQSFQPMSKPRILAAYLLDNRVGLKLFSLYKKMNTK